MRIDEVCLAVLLIGCTIFVVGGLLVILGAGTWALIDGLRSSKQTQGEAEG